MSGPILYVEDDDDDCTLMLVCFKDLGLGARIESARNGIEALDYLEKASRGETALPALIIADIKMPKMGGLELLERVRANALLDGIPFMILTASGDKRDRAEAARLGVDSYRRKPTSKTAYLELGAEILRLLEKAPA
ncbi:MAG: response regulator [Elusimicrobiota bacterium]|nr:response regulator [Elusimicrobiota bacterium]